MHQLFNKAPVKGPERGLSAAGSLSDTLSPHHHDCGHHTAANMPLDGPSPVMGTALTSFGQFLVRFLELKKTFPKLWEGDQECTLVPGADCSQWGPGLARPTVGSWLPPWVLPAAPVACG